jgi:hypothetical protein
MLGCVGLPCNIRADKQDRILSIRSQKQTFFTQNKQHEAYFEGLVDAQIGSHLHVWADTIETLGEGHELLAKSNSIAPVVIQDNNLLIFADEFRVNIDTKTGEAKNIRLHAGDGFVRASRAEKLSELDWRMEQVEYTACDRAKPDWSLDATKAVFRKGAFLRGTNVSFNICSVPVLGLPQIVVPVQFGSGATKGSKSGFLLPRFLIDYDYGLGIKQDYYNRITDQADTTLSVDWLPKKGLVLSNTFRWCHSADSYTDLYGHYAIVHDRYVRRGDVIRKGTSRGYWVKGKSFHQHECLVPGVDGAMLMRTDFGTDKRMEYHFFNSTDEVDDSFFNTVELRAQTAFGQVSLAGISNKVFRNSFVPLDRQRLLPLLSTIVLQQDQKMPVIRKDTEDRAQALYLPHFALNNTFGSCANLLQYRHDFFCDYVLYSQQEVERIFVDDTFLEQKEPLPYKKADFLRCTYAPHLKTSIGLPIGVLTPFCKPRVQLVARQQDFIFSHKNALAGSAFAYGGYRAYCSTGVEYALPLAHRYLERSGAFLSVQPMVTWTRIPRLAQEHWYYIDRWDRAYPTNNVLGKINMMLHKDNFSADFVVSQGYDFEKNNHRFLIARSLKQKYLMPFQYDAILSRPGFSLGILQEYDWPDFQLLQSQLTANITVQKVKIGLSYLFQKPQMLIERGYLSNIPHLLHLRVGVPLSKYASLSYEAQYYAPQRTSLFFLDGIKPLIHRVRFEYDAHCWGFFIGIEEKKFKECDVPRNERAIVFSLRLDSLGSFAKKLKRLPSFVRQPITQRDD